MFDVINENKMGYRGSRLFIGATPSVRQDHNKRVERRNTDGEFRRLLYPLQTHRPSPNHLSSTGVTTSPGSQFGVVPGKGSSAKLFPPPSPSACVQKAAVLTERNTAKATPTLDDATRMVDEAATSQDHQTSTPEVSTSSSLTRCNLPSPMHSESGRQTIVVDVYQPLITGNSGVPRPISLHWDRRPGVSDDGHFATGNSSSSSANHRSAPELRISAVGLAERKRSTAAILDDVIFAHHEEDSKTKRFDNITGNNDCLKSPNCFRSVWSANSLPSLPTTTSSKLNAGFDRCGPSERRRKHQRPESLPELSARLPNDASSAAEQHHSCLTSTKHHFKPNSHEPLNASSETGQILLRGVSGSPSSSVRTTNSENAKLKGDDILLNSTTTSKTSNSVGGELHEEASMQLWNLRAILADRGDDCSIEESIDEEPTLTTSTTSATPKTTTPPSADDASAKSSSETVIGAVDAEELRRRQRSADLQPIGGIVFVGDTSDLAPTSSGFAAAQPEFESTASAGAAPPEDGLKREPSIRRQTYRDAIARRQQQKNQQRLNCNAGSTLDAPSVTSAGNSRNPSGTVAAAKQETVATGGLVPPTSGEASSDITDDNESSVSFERHFETGGYSASLSAAASSVDTVSSFRDSFTSNESIGAGAMSTCSEASHGSNNGNHRLENLRGDSGYRSLEAQQQPLASAAAASAGASLRDIRRLSTAAPAEVIQEDEREAIVSPTTKTNAGEPFVKQRSPENHRCQRSSKTNTSTTSGSGVNKQHIILVRHSKAAERKRIQYKCERQAVQIYDSMTGEATASQQQHSVTDSAILESGGFANVHLVSKTAVSDRAPDQRQSSLPAYCKNNVVELQGSGRVEEVPSSVGLAPVLNNHHRRCHNHYQQHSLSSSPKPTSSFFTRLLRTSPTGTGSGGGSLLPCSSSSSSSSRRGHLVRMYQRDYSVDERSDALFNEFVRHDPAYDAMHAALCLNSRRRSSSHRASHQHSGGVRSHRRRSANASPEDRLPNERRHRHRRVGHDDLERTTSGGFLAAIESTTGPTVAGGGASKHTSRSASVYLPVSGPKALLLTNFLTDLQPPSTSSLTPMCWLESATETAHSSSQPNDHSTCSPSGYGGSRGVGHDASLQTATTSADDKRREINPSLSASFRTNIATSSSPSLSDYLVTSTTARRASGSFELTSITVERGISDTSTEVSTRSPEVVSGDTIGDSSSPGSDDVGSLSDRSRVAVESIDSKTKRVIPVIQLTTEDEKL